MLKNLKPFESPLFVLFLIALVMFNNLEHVAETYLRITLPDYDNKDKFDFIKFLAYSVSALIDLSIIAFIHNGKNDESKAFAIILFFINAIFWTIYEDIRSTSLVEDKNVVRIFTELLYSGIFSYLQYRLSILYFELKHGFSTIKQAESLIKEKDAKLEQDKALLQQKQASIVDLKNMVAGAKALNTELHEKIKQLEAYKSIAMGLIKCPSCNFIAPVNKGYDAAVKSINAHKGTCKGETVKSN